MYSITHWHFSGLTLHEVTPIMLFEKSPNICYEMKLIIKELKDNLIVTTIITCPAADQLAHRYTGDTSDPPN